MQLFHTCENSGYVLRSSNLKLSQPKPKPKTNFLKNSFSCRGAAYWTTSYNKLVENPKRVNKLKNCPLSIK